MKLQNSLKIDPKKSNSTSVLLFFFNSRTNLPSRTPKPAQSIMLKKPASESSSRSKLKFVINKIPNSNRSPNSPLATVKNFITQMCNVFIIKSNKRMNILKNNKIPSPTPSLTPSSQHRRLRKRKKTSTLQRSSTEDKLSKIRIKPQKRSLIVTKSTKKLLLALITTVLPITPNNRQKTTKEAKVMLPNQEVITPPESIMLLISLEFLIKTILIIILQTLQSKIKKSINNKIDRTLIA